MFQDDISNILSRETASQNQHHGVGDISWQALGPATACTFLSVAVVAMRWYTRYKLASCVGLDDYVILLSVVRINFIQHL